MTSTKSTTMLFKSIFLKGSSFISIKHPLNRSFCQEVSEAQQKYLFRCGVQIDPSLEDLTKQFKYRKHPGRRNTTPVELPERFVKAAYKIYTNSEKKDKSLIPESMSFKNHISRRMLPVTDREIRAKAQEILTGIVEQDDVDIEDLSDDARESLEHSQKDRTVRKLKTKIYNWQPIDYNEHNSMLYLLGCFAPNYATLVKIFEEIKMNAPEFKPKTFLDFGSGVGTGIWAVNNCFEDCVSEVLCVDASGDMNQLNQLLLQDGDPEGETWIKNLFFKRHLPPSNLIKYDLVISAHTLMDLPNSRERIQVVNNLWNKTQDMLVIVEHGSFAGHSIVIEARDYILGKTEDDPYKKPVYVIAPCEHDHPCPKSKTTSKRPCSFPVKYHPLSFYKGNEAVMEKYSYIVLSKKKHKEASKWPRLISPVRRRSNHVICRMCHVNGKLYESIVTRYSCGRNMYRIAKCSKWGDLLPASVVNEETLPSDDEHSSGEESSDSESETNQHLEKSNSQK